MLVLADWSVAHAFTAVPSWRLRENLNDCDGENSTTAIGQERTVGFLHSGHSILLCPFEYALNLVLLDRAWCQAGGIVQSLLAT